MFKDICLIITITLFCFANAFTAVPWDGSVADSFAGGTGSQEDPYQIADGSQLAYLHNYVINGLDTESKYFVLTDDIILNSDTINFPNEFCPIGASKMPGCAEETGTKGNIFRGVFDGQGYSIIGLNPKKRSNDGVVPGLFGFALFATIKNFTLHSFKIDGENIVSGVIWHGQSTRIENIVVYGNFVGTECYPINANSYGNTIIRVQTHGNCSQGGNGIGGGYPKVFESFSTVSFGSNNPHAAGIGGDGSWISYESTYVLRVANDSLQQALGHKFTSAKNSYYANASESSDENVYFPYSSNTRTHTFSKLFLDAGSSATLTKGRRIDMKTRAAVDSLNSGLDSLVWAFDSCGINYGYPYLIYNPPYGKNTVCESPSSSSSVAVSSSSVASSSSAEISSSSGVSSSSVSQSSSSSAVSSSSTMAPSSSSVASSSSTVVPSSSAASSSSAGTSSSSSSLDISSSSESATLVKNHTIAPSYQISVNGYNVVVANVTNVNIRIFDLLGHQLERQAVYGTGSASFTVTKAGVYILRIGSQVETINVR